jgi:hypothetical protein
VKRWFITPEGITTREEAEALIGLNARLGRADRAWAQWLVSAITNFAERRERLGVEADQGTVAWLERVLGTTGTSTSVGRRIAREIRREVARLHGDAAPAPESVEPAPAEAAEIPAETQAVTIEYATAEPVDPAPKLRKPRRAKRSAVAPRSRIIMPSKKRAKPLCHSNPLTMPPLMWTAVAEKHLQFRLAAPCA